MTCQRIDRLDDADLLAYLDGEADDRVAAHVAACPDCRARADTLAQRDGALRALFFRTTCPSPTDLRDFHFHLLSIARSQDIVHHLEVCPHCTRELFDDYSEFYAPAARRDVSAQDVPTPGHATRDFLGRVRLAVARLLEGGASLQPAFALRSAASSASQAYMMQVEDSMVSLLVHPDFDFPDRLAIEGQALLTEPASTAMHVHLWQDDRLAALCVLDEAGDFAIPRLPPGRYELILSSANSKIRLPAFQVGPHEPERR